MTWKTEKIIKTCPICNKPHKIEVSGDDGTDPKAIVNFAEMKKFHENYTGSCEKCSKENQLKNDRQIIIDRNLKILNYYPIPFEFLEDETEHFDPKKAPDGGKLAFNLLAQFRRNLFISNDYDNGKTRSMAFVAKKLLFQGHKILYITANTLFAKYSSKSQIDKENANNWLKTLFYNELLIVDDLRKKEMTGSNIECLYELTDHHYTLGLKGCKMWLSANKSPKIVFDVLRNHDAADAAQSRLIRQNFKNPFQK